MSRYPIIVLDGPDGTGKSTLANKLCGVMGAHYIHLTYRFGSKMFDYHTAAIFQALRRAETQPVIMDRWWPSEIVYADAYRGGSKWPLGKRMFEKIALKHSITYVFCLPSDRDKYLEHYNILKGKREEMYDSGMERVYDGFRKVYNGMLRNLRTGVSSYDFMKDGHRLDEIAQVIISIAEDQRKDQWPAALNRTFMNFTGDTSQAKYLLVGDQLKPKTRREVWPFFEYGNSSLWLAEALEDAGIPENQLMFMNAMQPNSNKTETRIATFLESGHVPGDLEIIAMGNVAAEYLNSLKLTFTTIKHPQYYRRFSPNPGKDIVKETFQMIRSS